jgi:methylase of polypeptide subunit release factors
MGDVGLKDRETDFERLFKDLGFICRPLFGASHPIEADEGRSVLLLDGAAASFVMTVREQPSLLQDEVFYDWAWSVDVPHHVEIVAPRETDAVVLMRRWDSPGTLRRFTLPSVLRHGFDFLEVLEQAGRPRALRVLQHGLRLFRIVRESIGSATAGDESPILVFHCLLRSAAAAEDPEVKEKWLRAETVGEMAQLIGEALPPGLDSVRLPGGIQEEFLRPESTTGRRMEAGLLLRHAAGALYQEAHLELSSSQLPLLVGREPLLRGKSLRKDVVYTPPGLARLLAELAWASLEDNASREGLTVLDPACGSGIFLSEMYRIFAEGKDGGARFCLRLIGMDVSPAAALMARLVLADVQKEMLSPPQDVLIEVEAANALTESWPACDIVLMNPPFIAWDDLEIDRRQALLEACGLGQGGRPDLAMAFVSLGMKALRPGGVLATVLPSALLETRSGHQWREGLFAQASPVLIARLRGGDIFPGVMLEPSVLILRKSFREESDVVLMGYSEPGSGEAFLRALRRRKALGEKNKRYEIYEVPTSNLQAVSWLPRSRRLQNLVQALAGNRRVGDLFDVRQGLRTGANDVFVLAADELRRLPVRERPFFRALAGSKTIQEGRIEKSQYVFYPYEEGGTKLQSEEELQERLRFYYDRYLKPNRLRLQARTQFSGSWWELDRPRLLPWQFRQPKLVSAYFGRPGKFALDESGEFVVGQGFAWLFKLPAAGPSLPVDVSPLASDDEVADVDGLTRQVGPCYLAVFNSRCFEALLAHFAPRVQGGQFDLSPRFVHQIPIPDLVSEGAVSSDIVSNLRQAGEKILEGQGIDRSSWVERWVTEAYGLSLEEWPLGDEL